MKKTLLTVLTLILTITLGSQIAKAIGSLTPSGTAGDATQYTLNDIYTRLTTNNSTSTKSGTFTTPGSVTATFRTLTEIYNAIPTIEAAKVATGTSYLGVTGTLATSTPVLQWSADIGLSDDTLDGEADCAALGTGWRLPTLLEIVVAIADEWLLETVTPGSGFTTDTWYLYRYSESHPEYTAAAMYDSGINDVNTAHGGYENVVGNVRCVR